VLLSTRDRESELMARYLANYDQIAVDDLTTGIQKESLQRFFNERLRGYLGNFAGQRVCDVGVGKGMLFEMLGQGGAASVVGVDISMPYLERFAGLPDTTVVLANAENLPFRDAFDLVVAADVLEHVLNVGDFLICMREALAPKGRFVVRVPYRENLVKYAHLVYDCPYDLVHLRSFNNGNLRELLRYAGFVVERLQYDGFGTDRARPWPASTRVGRRLIHEFGHRLLGGQDQLEQMNPQLGRLLMEPIVVTAITRRR
jgi:SAM-dependent methyltransferase